MRDTPLVSIVVVSYDNWPDVELAVASALSQTYRSVEVIVVDNGSSDRTCAELPRLFGERIRLHRQANAGDAGAYNTGLGLSRGDLVQFIDGDDWLTPYKIEKQAALLLDDPKADIVYGDIRKFQMRPGPARWMDQETRGFDDMLAALLKPEPHGAETLLGFLFRKSALERVGRWDEQVFCTDLDYWLRAAWLGCRFRRCEGLMGFSQKRPGQMSANVAALRRGTEAVFEKALTYIDREPYRAMAESYLARHRLFMAAGRIGMSRREALAKLRQARGGVGALASLIAAAAVLLPGESLAARAEGLRPARRLAARLLGYRLPRY